MVDRPGGAYWRTWDKNVREHLLRNGFIAPEDLNLYQITDNTDQAVKFITRFYRNYHSMRFVRELLVIRLKHPPTPSAIEGLNMATDAAAPYVAPLTCLVLFGLFFIQQYGTARIGALFGPIMVVWFLVLAGLGLRAIVGNPQILQALDPRQALHFFVTNGGHGFLVLGSVVLCITGGEALYADMGHFGRAPIRLSWYGAVLPGLVARLRRASPSPLTPTFLPRWYNSPWMR